MLTKILVVAVLFAGGLTLGFAVHWSLTEPLPGQICPDPEFEQCREFYKEGVGDGFAQGLTRGFAACR